jgi:hypothetical protein
MGRRPLGGAGSEINKIHEFFIQHSSRIHKESEYYRRYGNKKPMSQRERQGYS